MVQEQQERPRRPSRQEIAQQKAEQRLAKVIVCMQHPMCKQLVVALREYNKGQKIADGNPYVMAARAQEHDLLNWLEELGDTLDETTTT